MTDENPKKRVKNEKAEQLELAKELVQVRAVSTEIYEVQLKQSCKNRLRSMNDGTATKIKLPKFYDASTTAKLVDANEATLEDINRETLKYDYIRRENNNTTETLEHKMEKLRKLREIERRKEANENDDF